MGFVAPPGPLREDDDRESFDCGRESLNLWFRRHGWANHAGSISRTNVIRSVEGGKIIGYTTLSAAQIERAYLPKPLQRNKPDPLPVTLLGRLAVHKDYQGQGHARSLLFFALKTSLRMAGHIGSFGVVTHPIDASVRAFYVRWGFQPLPFDPKGAMIVRMADLRISFLDADAKR